MNREISKRTEWFIRLTGVACGLCGTVIWLHLRGFSKPGVTIPILTVYAFALILLLRLLPQWTQRRGVFLVTIYLLLVLWLPAGLVVSPLLASAGQVLAMFLSQLFVTFERSGPEFGRGKGA